jgi:hypothetical protein
MHVDVADLRVRMRSRRADDLERIIRNQRSDYTPAAVQAARDELATRPADADPVEESFVDSSVDESWRSRLPGGLRVVYWLASAAVVLGLVIICVALIVVLASGETLRELLPKLRGALGTVALGLFVAISIRAERSYVRILLLSLSAATVVNEVVLIVVKRSFTLDEINTLGVLIVAFWYFQFNDGVRHYYRGLRASGSDH